MSLSAREQPKKGSERPAAVSRSILVRLAGLWYPTGDRALALWAGSVQSTLQAGMPVHQGLLTVARGCRHPGLRAVTERMAAQAGRGRPISSVADTCPGLFPPYVRPLLQAGETSGDLAGTFGRLADLFENSFQLAMLHKWLTFYPKLLLVLYIVNPGAFWGLLMALLEPASLPGFLWGIWLRLQPWVLAGVVIWGSLRLAGRLAWLRLAADWVKLHLPWLGGVFRKASLATWGQALATLVNAGLPLHAAVTASAPALGNLHLQRALLARADGLLNGQPLGEVLVQARCFPRELVEMVSIGDHGGGAAGALDRMAQYYRDESRAGQRQAVHLVGALSFAAVAYLILSHTYAAMLIHGGVRSLGR